jgi:hypothetical protein
MTKHARIVALELHAVLPGARGLGCVHGVLGWGLCTGAAWGALLQSGHVKPGDLAEWRQLCGIPPQAEVEAPELEGLGPVRRGKES